MHLEEFPVGYLSLLPLSEREWLLQRLPIADVCLLEDTDFTKGIDMEAVWKLPPEPTNMDDSDSFIEEWGEAKFTNSDIFIEEWGGAKFAKAAVYGEIASIIIGCLPDDFWYPFPGGEVYIHTGNEIEFLYAIRRFPDAEHNSDSENTCDFTVPSRYQEKANLLVAEDLTDAAVSCFGGEFPKILTGVYVDDSVKLEYVDFLHDLRFLSVIDKRWYGSNITGVEFVQKVLKVAIKLEVLNLYGDEFCDYRDEERRSLDDLCSDLASHPTFWSKFRLFQIFNCTPGYTVSQEYFDKLVTAYLSTPTDRAQKVRFSDTRIVAYGTHPTSPKFNRNYVQFKTIELVNCTFISKCPAEPDFVSRWLGQSIHVLESKEQKACSFQVKVPSSVASKKRRYPEIDSDNND